MEFRKSKSQKQQTNIEKIKENKTCKEEKEKERKQEIKEVQLRIKSSEQNEKTNNITSETMVRFMR
jgi:hypothetical protein